MVIRHHDGLCFWAHIAYICAGVFIISDVASFVHTGVGNTWSGDLQNHGDEKRYQNRTISCSFAYMEDWVLATTVFLFCLLGVLETWVAHVLLSVLMLGDLYLGVGSCCAFLYDWVSACFWDGIWVFEQSVDIRLVVWLVIPLSDWDLWCVVGYKVHSMDMVKIMMVFMSLSCHISMGAIHWNEYTVIYFCLICLMTDLTTIVVMNVFVDAMYLWHMLHIV